MAGGPGGAEASSPAIPAPFRIITFQSNLRKSTLAGSVRPAGGGTHFFRSADLAEAHRLLDPAPPDSPIPSRDSPTPPIDTPQSTDASVLPMAVIIHSLLHALRAWVTAMKSCWSKQILSSSSALTFMRGRRTPMRWW